MNAALLAVVVFNPRVWEPYATKAISPRIKAGLTTRRSKGTQINARAVRLNRNAKSTGTGMVSRASLITTKVVPQIKVTPTSAKTARRNGIGRVSHAGVHRMTWSATPLSARG